ncbi:hypothetical protein CO046_01075 [Candidatus Peregrinibacteria bacterium CG_4_9_14_0_2_um_filter_53_11]|nr:MAG: hypothetical protein CO046_01075 [Candidatus Peregrinibacteria bacterium CG_4_9_14_0_2_um_filter_53_11]
MIIGLDFDGTIINWDVLKEKASSSFLDISLPKNKNMSTANMVQQSLLTSEQAELLLSKIFSDRATLEMFEFIPGALEVIQYFVDKGFEIKIITARPESPHFHLNDWFANYGFSFEVVYTSRMEKGTYAADCLAYVDDDYRVLENMTGSLDNLFLLNQEYNEHEIVTLPINRVASWSDLKEKILALS